MDLSNFTGSHNLYITFTTGGKYIYEDIYTTFYIDEVYLLYVSSTGHGDGSSTSSPTTFVDALNRIGVGGTIVLLDGSYINIRGQEIVKSITIKGSDFSVINGGNSNRAFTVSSGDVIICNITFNNGRVTGNGGAILWNGDNGVLSDCTFNNNYATVNGGAVYWSGVNGTLKNSKFNSNTADFVSDNIYCVGELSTSNNTFITNSRIVNGVLKVSSVWDNSPLSVVILIDDTPYKTITFNANSNDNFELNLLTLGLIASNVTVKYSSTGSNFYEDNYFDVSSLFDIIFASYGVVGGNGSQDNPYNFTKAFEVASNGRVIVLLEGNYTDILNFQITKSVIIQGWGRVVIDAQGQSKMFTVRANNVVIQNITFVNGYVSGGETDNVGAGGAISWIGNNGQLLDCKFINITGNGRVSYGGGGIHVIGNNLEIAGCSFENCSNINSDYGGVIFCYGRYANGGSNGKYISVHDCNFTNNKLVGNKGGAFSSYFRFDLVNCIFTNNSATNNGGAVFADVTGGNVIRDCVFEDNKVTGGDGGAIYTSVSTTIYDSNFTNNVANGYAGAIYHNNGVFKVDNCTFTNNGGDQGGVIYDNVGNSYIYNSNFTNNSATSSGGAIYLSANNYESIYDNLRFYNNSAVISGSAILTRRDVSINNSEFLDNKVRSLLLDIIKVGNNNLTIAYTGADNYLNAIQSAVNLTKLFNVTYWGASGKSNTDITGYSKRSNLVAGQNVVVELYNKVTGSLISNNTYTTDVNGEIVISDLTPCYYDIIVYHPENTYYRYINQSSSWLINGSFSDLYNLLKNKPTELTLFTNYIFDSVSDNDFINGVNIDSKVTIDGNGFMISGCDVARIFNISADNVLLCNLTLCNANATCGGAIYWSGSNGAVKRSKFYNNTVVNGSAIYTVNELNIGSSEFLDNTANVDFTYAKTDDGLVFIWLVVIIILMLFIVWMVLMFLILLIGVQLVW